MTLTWGEGECGRTDTQTLRYYRLNRSRAHNCMAISDRAVVVLAKEFQWDQTPLPLKNFFFFYLSNN